MSLMHFTGNILSNDKSTRKNPQGELINIGMNTISTIENLNKGRIAFH